MYRSLLIYQKA